MMNHQHPLANQAETEGQDIVYVRPVDIADLPDEVREQAEGVADLYSVHDAQGQRLALVQGRDLAFVLARQNDLMPVSVH